jgi:hypothetical protein
VKTIRALDLATIVKHVWEPPPWLRRNEHVTMEVYGLEATPFETAKLVAQRYIAGRYGEPLKVGWRSASVYFAVGPMRWTSERLVDELSIALHYIVSIVCPRPPPKGWRLFGRKPWKFFVARAALRAARVGGPHGSIAGLVAPSASGSSGRSTRRSSPSRTLRS